MIKFNTLAEAEAYNELICEDLRIVTEGRFIALRWSDITEKDGAFYMETHPDYPHNGVVVEVPTVQTGEEI